MLFGIQHQKRGFRLERIEGLDFSGISLYITHMNRKGDKKTLLPPGFNKVKKLGEGAGSVVWSVKHETTREKLVLKLATETDPAHRLQREFAILERLDVPGVIKVREFGEHEGCEYFTMELIEGKPIINFMSQRRKGKGFVELFLNVFQRAAAVLLRLHHEGIVHIDIKPANLLVKEDGEPVLLDFGFAEDYVLSSTAEARGTTLEYAAPELFSGGHITSAADIYSLGVISYEVLTEKKLWSEKSVRELIAAKLKTPPGLGKLEFDIPSGLEELIFRMLNPEPGLRPSADEIIAEIRWLTKGEKVEVEPPGMVPRFVFGGRDAEMKKIKKLIFGEKRVVFLSGDQGIGKTRLLRELRFRAILSGHNVLFIEGRGAHLSLVEYISSSLGVEHPKIDPDKEQRPDKWSRYERIFQVIEKGGFDGVFIEAPVDLTEDESGLLGYLSRGFDGKLGLILSQVSEQVHPDAAQIELVPLDEERVMNLVSKTFEGLKETNKLAHTLASVAEGNPRRMNELLDILHDEGWLRWKRGWVYDPAKEEKGLAEKLESWLGDSVEQLNDNSKLALNIIAVAESAVPAEVIASILGEAKASLVLQGLVNAGFLRSFTYLDRPHYECGNDVIGPYLRGKLATRKKKALAKKLAEALERFCIKLWGDDLNIWLTNYLVQIASLYSEAGVDSKSVHYLIFAGKRLVLPGGTCDITKARKLLTVALKSEPAVEERKEILFELIRIANIERDHKAAEDFYSQIFPLVEENPTEKAKILLAIGSAYLIAGNLDQARSFLDKSEACITDPPRSLRWKQLQARGSIAYRRGKIVDAYTFYKECLEFASSISERCETHCDLAAALFTKGQPSEALENAKRSLELTKEGADKTVICIILHRLVCILRSFGKLEEAGNCMEQALVLIKEIDHPSLIVDVLFEKIVLLSFAGRIREARVVTRQAMEHVHRFNDTFKINRLRFTEAEISKTLGDWETAQIKYRKIWQGLHGTASRSSFIINFLSGWSDFYVRRGEFLISRRLLNKAKKLAQARKNDKILFWIELWLCEVSIEEENLAEARTLLEKSKLLSDTQEEAVAEIYTGLCEAKILLAEGKKEEALRVTSQVVSNILNYPGLRHEHILALLLQGRTLVACGKYPGGLAKLHESLKISISQERPYEQGFALYAIAEAMFEHKGYSDEAVSALEEAQTIFERLGAKHMIEKGKKLREKHMTDRQDKTSEQYLKKLKQVSELIKDLRAEHFAEVEEKLGLSYQYLEGLREISELINQRLGKENFMDALLKIVLKLTSAQRGVIFFLEGDELHPVTSKHMDDAASQDAIQISHTAIDNLRQGLEPVYTSDASSDERFSSSQSIILNDIRSLMCIPLKIEDRLVGIIYVDSKQPGLFDAPRTMYFEAIGNLLAATIEKSAEFKRLQEELILSRQSKSFEASGIVTGTSSAMKKLYSQLSKIAASDTNILLEGETGTGKGVFARMIHEQSNRKHREFCCINCGVLPENIFESELFGTVKGAYTGATRDRMGLLEAANGSTAFFDEITNTSASVQAKLLEVIEEKVIRRIGETRPRQVDLRFIIATNRDLKAEVKAGRFREDLYFRISTVTLTLPPLRDRKEDISEFVDFFCKKFAKEFNKDITSVEDDALELLLDYPWQGNIRELRNVIERAVLMRSGRSITRDLLEPYLFPVASYITSILKVTDKAQKQAMIKRALAETEGNITQAAKRLGVSRRHLYRLMARYGVSRKPD